MTFLRGVFKDLKASFGETFRVAVTAIGCPTTVIVLPVAWLVASLAVSSLFTISFVKSALIVAVASFVVVWFRLFLAERRIRRIARRRVEALWDRV